MIEDVTNELFEDHKTKYRATCRCNGNYLSSFKAKSSFELYVLVNISTGTKAFYYKIISKRKFGPYFNPINKDVNSITYIRAHAMCQCRMVARGVINDT